MEKLRFFAHTRDEDYSHRLRYPCPSSPRRLPHRLPDWRHQHRRHAPQHLLLHGHHGQHLAHQHCHAQLSNTVARTLGLHRLLHRRAVVVVRLLPGHRGGYMFKPQGTLCIRPDYFNPWGAVCGLLLPGPTGAGKLPQHRPYRLHHHVDPLHPGRLLLLPHHFFSSSCGRGGERQ